MLKPFRQSLSDIKKAFGENSTKALSWFHHSRIDFNFIVFISFNEYM